jgi:isopenicillin N synthase-like dioxygenase
MSSDEMRGVSTPISHPPGIEAHRSDIKAYMEQAHSIVILLCSCLESNLGLASGTFASLQAHDRPSGTGLRMLRYPPQPEGDRRTSLAGHTDFGTLTILFNISGGLQVLLPSAEPEDANGWVYVKPVPGCAVVSLGDTMVEWTAGILRSNMHRVTYAPGEQGKVTRYSLAYLARPHNDASMRRLVGGNSVVPRLKEGEEDNLLTVKEWEVQKTIAIQLGKGIKSSRGGREIDLPRWRVNPVKAA